MSELAGVLRDRGWCGPVVALDGPPEGPLAALSAGRWHRLSQPLWRFARDVQRAARECDAALAHWTVPSGVLTRCVGLPTVGVAHGGDVRLLERTGLGLLVGKTLRGVVAVSTAAAQTFGDVPTLVTPMGVHSCRFQHAPPLNQPPRRLLFVGRLVPIKGVELVLEATARLSLPLTIVGDGPERTRLAERYPHAHLLGARPPADIPGLMAAHDLLLVPSVGQEGAPVVVAEACAAGRPVVASDIGGLVDMVPASMRLPAGDLEAWTRALAAYVAGERRTEPVGARDRFDWSVVGARVGDFLSRTLRSAVI